MATDPLSTLADRLGTTPAKLAPLKACSATELQHLDDAVAGTLDREDEAVETGLQATLGAIPRPLRSRAKALLFPSEDA